MKNRNINNQPRAMMASIDCQLIGNENFGFESIEVMVFDKLIYFYTNIATSASGHLGNCICRLLGF